MEKLGMIFIHGAGLGSFIWDDLKPVLKLPTLMVDFPNRNHGDKANLKLTFEDYFNSVVEQINSSNFNQFILVTHSIGGCIGLKIADYFKDRMVGFVAIGSAIPSEGNSFISCLPFPQKIIMPLILRMAGTKPPQKAIRGGLCNDLSKEQADRIVKNFTPESKSLYLERCEANVPNTKKLYIKLIKDKEFTPSLQDKMAKNLGAQKVVRLESGHLPMLSKPEKLAKVINNFAVQI